MSAHFPEQRVFFTTGRRHGDGIEPIDGLALRPAVLARYRDLTLLRYDYPVVLVASGAQAGSVRPLSGVVDELLAEVAPRGLEGERLRRHVLRLEREIRVLLGCGATGTLSQLWAQACARLAVPEDPTVEAVLVHTGRGLPVDGDVVDCDEALPSALLAHLWGAAQRRKAEHFRSTAEQLKVKLSDILRAAFIHSEAGRRPDALRAAVGSPHREQFDFDAMARLIGRRQREDDLPPARRRRIEWSLSVLREQDFYPEAGRAGGFGFRFEDCAAAAEAFRTRLPKLAQVVKAIAVAELEVDGRYIEEQHDAFFEGFDERSLSAHDLALFPDYLVCIPPSRNSAPENAALMDMLSAGLPVKVLVETSDLLEDASIGMGRFAFGVRSVRLANTATSLGGVFVVQSSSSNLHALNGDLTRGFAHPGPALFSVYSGAGVQACDLPYYLSAASAMESRAFPAFTYDPYGGGDQASRFTLSNNPQPEEDWPVLQLDYADERLQRVSEEVAFTFADFVLCDRRYASHFSRVPRERWNAAMVPAHEWLAREAEGSGELIPYILAVDRNDVLQRIVVDSRLMQAASRLRTFWRRLQEQGGIHNSHAERLLAREKARWEEEKLQLAAASEAAGRVSEPAQAGAPAPAAAAAPAPAAQPEAAVLERSTDEAWIETARCPSCNECALINDRMFRYNENKQAYIADITAGTYRQLVEAAEVCQVSIIHPGKPRDPSEPGIEELLERARAFL